MPEVSVLRIQPGARVATPLCRVAQELALLSGGRRYGLGLLLGALAAAALPPIDLTPLVFVAFPCILWLDSGSAGAWASFRLGWVFGFGFFVAGMYWVAAALFVDIARFWWLVPFAVAGLPALLALCVGAAFLAAHVGSRGLGLSATARAVFFAVAWSAFEWVRGHALSGLPWNLIGYAWAGGFPGATAVLENVAWIGIYGLSFLTVLAAALPALLGAPSLAPMSRTARAAPAIAAALLVLVPAAAGALRLARSPTRFTATRLRLVQPSIPQSLKWDPRRTAANFRRLLALSAAPARRPLAAILWPEAAVIFPLDRDGAARQAIAGVAPKGGYVLTGVLRGNPPPAPLDKFWNSIEAVDGSGRILAHYDKTHLVPFGEYVPLREVLPLPLKKVTAGSVDLSAGRGPRTIALKGLPPFAPIICYEAIFPGAIVDERDRPEWLFNVTNDAWYGHSSGPYQHFAIARTRAIEEGLPLVRVANNGISGVVDAAGRVVARIDLDDVGYADVALPAAGPRTLYSWAGDRLFFAMLVLALLPAALRLR
ncbi:MAG TPA: apolipoprotein N-acyltransferase [Stellaceae bacterium]|nr:apolipoprotein N-acyltransferase [Stellaceae bacterium]